MKIRLSLFGEKKIFHDKTFTLQSVFKNKMPKKHLVSYFFATIHEGSLTILRRSTPSPFPRPLPNTRLESFQDSNELPRRRHKIRRRTNREIYRDRREKSPRNYERG